MAILKDYSGGVTETAVIATHREIAEHKERMKSAQGKLREARKRAEESGMDPWSYDLAVKLSNLDEVEAVTRLNKVFFYLKTLRTPLGGQVSFIDMVTDNANLTEEQRLERWYDEGYNAGANGKGQDTCRHPMNMPAGQAWLNGWSAAQAELAKRFLNPDEDPGEESGEEQVEAAAEAPTAEEPPKRRGRPPGSGSKRKPKEPEAAAAAADTGPIAPADGWGDAGGVDSYNPNAAPPPPPPAADEDDEMVPFDDAPPPPQADDAPAFVH